MARVKPLIPLVVGDEEALAAALCGVNCKHASNGSYKECEFTARNVMESGVVITGTDFLRGLHDNPVVKEAIQADLAEVWEEGQRAGMDNYYSLLEDDTIKNPYKETS